MNFVEAFPAMTGNAPFPWQAALYDRFVAGDIPASCNLPTGLGKTSVIAIWLIALANHPDKMPRRLVYVVNRRTVVDQTTEEVEKYRDRIHTTPGLFERLDSIGNSKIIVPFLPQPLAISTLRGQFADNREWSEDPSRPAVICGTVDMIGSRLLFSGYGIGRGKKPVHAGFLGQGALLVHDEAHLEPAFQELLIAIEKEQKRCKEFEKFLVMELTATSRGAGEPFELGEADRAVDEVKKRINAVKKLVLIENKDKNKLADEIAGLALVHHKSERAILVFVRKVDDVEKVVARLRKEKLPVQQLTGTLRGLERDRMADPRKPDGCPIFARFLRPPKDDAPEEERWKTVPLSGTVYLVCTSAGEVGVNISADHLVSDLSTFDSMAQRFGRVNRFGQRDDTRVDVVYPKEFDKTDDYDLRLKKTLDLLQRLNGDASPAALAKLPSEERVAAFAPPPTILPVSDILFDAWALTTIRGKLPGRPMVEPYLHGVSTWEPPETHVAWRTEVEELDPKYKNDAERKENQAADRRRLEKLAPQLLEDYPLKPHELLRDNSKRVFDRLSKLDAAELTPVWIVADDDSVEVTTLGELIEEGKEGIERKTVLLPPFAGGLTNGMLSSDDHDSDRKDYDVADEWFDKNGIRLRLRVWDKEDDRVEKMRPIREVVIGSPDADEEDEPRTWYWFEVANEGGKSSKDPVEWHIHVKDVLEHTDSILARLSLDEKLAQAVRVAAQFHDHGKRRRLFQLVLGNRNPAVVLAKSGKFTSRVPEKYRHEFGSLIDIRNEPDFLVLDDHQKEVVLHLIAVHHGRGRPHFPNDEVFDPENSAQTATDIACEVPRRYARLQRKYGRWGLAYLESLLRAADWSASANPSAFWKEEKS